MNISSNKQIVNKGWGYEEVLVNTEKYCAKILHMNKDKRFSWHYHEIKDETFYIENGRIALLYSEDDDITNANVIIMTAGDLFHVPVGLRHQVIGLENSRIFEFSTQHFEHDSIRVIKGD